MDNKRRNLIERVNRNRMDRAARKELDDRLGEKQRLIEESVPFQKMDFWCRTCRLDFEEVGVRRGLYGYDLDSGQSYPIPLERCWPAYTARCPNGHECIRHILEKDKDPYFWESENLQRERARMADDLLQPGDPRFNAKYGNPFFKAEQERERQEREAYDRSN